MQRGLGDQQIGNRNPVPHSVVVGEIPLQYQGTSQDVSGCIDDDETCAQGGFGLVVLAS